jgi:hypothetical protein
MQLVSLDVLPFRQLRPPLRENFVARSLFQEVQTWRADCLLNVFGRNLAGKRLELGGLRISLSFWRVIFLQCSIGRSLGDAFELARRTSNLSLVVQVLEESFEVLMPTTELLKLVAEEYLNERIVIPFIHIEAICVK